MAEQKKKWKLEKGKWVQYQNGAKTGKTRRTPPDAVTGLATRPVKQLTKAAKVTTGLATRPAKSAFTTLRKGASLAKRVGMGVMHLPNKKQQAEIDEGRKKRQEKEAKRESLKNKNQPKVTKTKTPTTKTKPSTTTEKKSDSLKVTKSTSPKKKYTTRDRMRAQNVKIHGEKRIKAVEQSHKDWKAARKKKKG